AANLPPDHVGLIPWEEAGEGTIGACLAGKRETARRELADTAVSLFIGPEGGFTSDEIELARQRGITPVTLGQRILRAETAAIAAATLVMHALGEL
ncbi:MAG: RsmE family RNA methyltransferase, partial [Anaerolineae bacterium]